MNDKIMILPTVERALSAEERRSLKLYRRAASRVYERVIPYTAHAFEARILRPGRPDEADLIPAAEFIALLTAFRLIYAVKEAAHFQRVVNILAQAGDAELRKIAAALRADWKAVLRRPLLFNLHGEQFDPASLLDTWFNGEVFHQNVDHIVRAELLRDLGALPQLVIQLTVRDLCFPILALDNVCGLALGEEMRPLPPVAARAE